MIKMITTEELNKIKEDFIVSMKYNFKRDGQLFPIASIIAPDGKMTIIGTPYSTHEEKAVVTDYIIKTCKELDAIALFIINEAWVRVSKGSLEEAEKEMKDAGKRISDYDDKKEVALIVFETKFTTETTFFDIDRTTNELINKKSGVSAGGNFSNILSPAIQKN